MTIISKIFNFINCKIIVILLGLFSLSALVAAYISQYVFGFQPCILCIYQRVPFFVILALAIFAIIIKSKKATEIVFYLCLTALIINSLIAFYHVGVEFKIFKGFSGCSGQALNNIDDLEALKQALINQPSVKCDEPQFYFLGLTMAFWNMLFCLLLIISAIIAKKLTKAKS